ncbi:hypothetical protein H8E88_23125 [candidate division KSB1 bacterium]|nr:hypothetical protein [candidate division KSB1 bacterium]
MQSIINKFKDISNSQTALIEKYAICQLEMEEKGYSEQVEKISEIAANISGSIENLKRLIGDCEIIINREKQ